MSTTVNSGRRRPARYANARVFGGQHGAQGRRIAFDRFAAIVRIEKFGQRLAGHPVGAALLVEAGDAHIGDLHVDEAALLQPAFQRLGGRDKIHVAHLRVTIARHQHLVAIAFHHQRFQHQFTFSHQLIFQLIEMIERRAAVIQYPIENTVSNAAKSGSCSMPSGSRWAR